MAKEKNSSETSANVDAVLSNKLSPDTNIFLSEYAKLKLEDERKRYESLFNQTINMQTVFSFVTAGICMVIPVIIDNRDNISLNCIFWWISAILFFLMASFVAAFAGQKREKMFGLGNIDETIKYVENNPESYSNESQRALAIAHLYSDIQKEWTKKNDYLVKCIRISRIFFAISIALIISFYITAIRIMF